MLREGLAGHVPYATNGRFYILPPRRSSPRNCQHINRCRGPRKKSSSGMTRV
jgi:hypothetical protein